MFQTKLIEFQSSVQKLILTITCIINDVRLVDMWRGGWCGVGGWLMRCATTTATTTANTGATSNITTTTNRVKPLRLLCAGWAGGGTLGL